MTATVAVVHDGRVFMAADSAGVAGYSINYRRDPKVFVNGPYVIGFAGSFRVGQLMRCAYELIPPDKKADLYDFMVLSFVDLLRDLLSEAGALKRNNEVDELAANFLVGIRGRLFEIESDFQVAEYLDGYAAIGCGEDLARGSLHTTASQPLTPQDRLTAALNAAAYHSAGVSGPYNYVEEPR